MASIRRDHIEHDRLAGFDAAVGLVPTRRRRRSHADGRLCSHCGAVARIDMVDMARTRAYLTCVACGNEWDTDRMNVVSTSGRRRREPR